MRGTAISLIALVPMLIHSILGCCWHHAHAPKSQQATSTAKSLNESVSDRKSASGQAHREHVCCSSSPVGDGKANELPAGDPCDEIPCTYDDSSLSLGPLPVSLLEWGTVSPAMAVLEQPTAGVTTNAQHQAPERFCSARERRALTQVWLL